MMEGRQAGKKQGGSGRMDKEASSPSGNGWHLEFAKDSERWQKERNQLEALNVTNGLSGLPIYKDYVGDESMKVIIDSGASVNYVSRRMAKGLKQVKLKQALPVKSASNMTTMVNTVVQAPG